MIREELCFESAHVVMAHAHPRICLKGTYPLSRLEEDCGAEAVRPAHTGAQLSQCPAAGSVWKEGTHVSYSVETWSLTLRTKVVYALYQIPDNLTAYNNFKWKSFTCPLTPSPADEPY